MNWRSYAKFFLFSKWTLIVIVIVLGLVYYKAQINVQFNYYLTKWVKEVSKTRKNDDEKLKKIYMYMAYTTIANLITSLMTTIFTFIISIQLFRRMIKRLLYAPINLYFDVTPSGFILNRFAKDLTITEINLTK